MNKKQVKHLKTPSLPDNLKGMEIVHHANFIEYLAKKNIKVVEDVNKKTKEKFLHLSKPLPTDLKKKIINNLLRNYADADSINRAIEDYQFENKPKRK
jgi:SOS response regulatory protein OraA/RecX